MRRESRQAVLLLVADNMILTHAGLGHREGTSASGLHLLLHHQGSGVMEVVNPVVMFFCDSSALQQSAAPDKERSMLRTWIREFHFLKSMLWCVFSMSQT